MTIRVGAKNDRGFYCGADERDAHVIFSLAAAGELELGDILESNDWDGSNNPRRTVRNTTQDKELKIYIENWDCPYKTAVNLMHTLGNPGSVTTL